MAIFGDNIPKSINDAIKDTGLTTGKPITLIRFDGDLITGNAFDVTINGVAVAQTTFATSHLATMRTIKTNLEAHADVSEAQLLTDSQGNTRQIRILGTTERGILTLTALAVAGGASQAGVEEDTSLESGTRAVTAIVAFVVEQSETATPSNVSQNAASVQLLAANANRRGVIVYNDTAALMKIKYGTTASATSFTFNLTVGATWEMPKPTFTGKIDAIWSVGGAGAARVTELT